MPRQLQYKLGWNGGRLIVVPAHNSSRECPACGHLEAANRFQQIVRRQSGSAAYTVIDTDPDRPVFQITYRYDGSAPGAGRAQIRDRGRLQCFNGKCQVNAETSGLVFDPVLWGDPPSRPAPGTTWRLRVPQPWELGPPGNETVRVVSVDPANAVIMLDREGHGSGQSDFEDLHT